MDRHADAATRGLELQAEIRELASLLADGYIRLLAARAAEQGQQKPLDVPDDNEAPLPKRVSRRKKLA